MNVQRRTTWIVGIGVVAVVLAASFLRRGSDELTVHLVDSDTGQPVNCAVTVREYRRYPVLSSMGFLPGWMRYSIKDFSITAHDGTFKIRRLKASERRSFLLEIRNDELKEYPGVQYRSTQAGTEMRIQSAPKVIQLEAQQKEVSLPLESRTYDRRR